MRSNDGRISFEWGTAKVLDNSTNYNSMPFWNRYTFLAALRYAMQLQVNTINLILTVSQKVEKVCHFERQREIYHLNLLVLLKFLPLAEVTIGQFGLFLQDHQFYFSDCNISFWFLSAAREPER